MQAESEPGVDILPAGKMESRLLPHRHGKKVSGDKLNNQRKSRKCTENSENTGWGVLYHRTPCTKNQMDHSESTGEDTL